MSCLTHMQQACAQRFRQLRLELEEAKKDAVRIAAAARKIAGPYGALLDAETFTPIRAATKHEVTASIAAAKDDDPVGPITVDGRKIFAVPPSLIDETNELTS